MEKRIYVVVADTVQPSFHPFLNKTMGQVWSPQGGDGTVVQVPGRQMAQVAHVVSKVRHNLLRIEAGRKAFDLLNKCGTLKQTRAVIIDLVNYFGRSQSTFEPITTIVLSCRDSKELDHIINLLSEAKILYEEFSDTNPPVYGINGEVCTAIATHPIEPKKLEGITDYLPLWIPKI